MRIQVAALKLIRLIHLYFGVFIAPSLVFFAFTGALQTLSLHESVKGSSYKPATWIIVLAQLHKKQTIELPASKIRQPASSLSPGKPGLPEKTSSSEKGLNHVAHNPLLLKTFFVLVSVGLFTSTLTGLYMSYKYGRNRLLLALLLIAGIVVPISLVFY